VPSIGRSRPAVLTLAGALAFAAAAGCSRAPGNAEAPPGNAETDRIAKVVADAIGYPRQDSAAGFARAALATRAGQDGRYYGIMGSPRRIACPRGATPVTPPTAAPKPRIAIPDGADELLERVLTGASRPPDAEKVHAALVEGLGRAAAAGSGPPLPQVAVDGADVGVALWEPDGRVCLLGARVGGQVLVWRPSRVQLQPGELSCDPQTALARQGTRPPH
jgi:hypothetical protein